ncbi:hypothetical protein GCM10009821_21180 [Aeromicrobium halocynthiae]|uniref:VanZ-like domain-containing protein n=1 Tax=Aeromicrobium halocynthiae TaxID=560557 RepID=A0ABN2W285_9ACTN
MPPSAQRLLAAGYVVVLLLIVGWPTTVDSGLDVAAWWPVRTVAAALGISAPTSYAIVEVGANVAGFAPLGWFAVTLFGARLGQVVVAFGTSVVIETLQTVLRPERFGTVSDVVANTVGAAIGAALAVWVVRRRARFDAGRGRSLS